MAEHEMGTAATRSSLLERLKNLDDREGWAEFFDTYWRLIYAVARRARMSDAEAMDVVQETMSSVAKELGGFEYNREAGSFRGWLGKLTRRRVADFFRKQSRQMPRGEPGAAVPIEEYADPNSPELETIWDEEWTNNLIQTALGRLRPHVSQRQYQLFHCHVIQGWGVLKTCRELGVNPAAVYLAKHRVGKRFKRTLEILQREE